MTSSFQMKFLLQVFGLNQNAGKQIVPHAKKNCLGESNFVHKC